MITNDRDNITIFHALESLRPGSEWTMDNNDGSDVLTWLDGSTTKPSTSAINAEIEKLKIEFDGNEYARSRWDKYTLLNQDEMRYDDLINGTTTWQDAIAAIKVAHPKP